MKKILMLFSLLVSSTLFALELPSWLTIKRDGTLQIESLNAKILHFGAGFVQTGQRDISDITQGENNGTVTISGKFGGGKIHETVTPIADNQVEYQAKLTCPNPWVTLGIMLQFNLPAKSRSLLLDGETRSLPAEFDGKKQFPLTARVKKVLIPLDSGSVLQLTGDLTLKVQDNRKFDDPTFSIRLYFNPAQGTLNVSSLKFRFSLIQPISHPIDLSEVVNLGFADEVAGDGKGGWTDQGKENDLRMLKPGRLPAGGSAFEILDPAKNGGRSALVLGRTFDKERSVEVETTGSHLYLLHAAGWPTAGTLGEIEVFYRNGSKESIEIRHGRDIGNWWMPVHLDNAVMIWNAENRSSYVGLYASQFKLRRNDPIKLTFRMRKSSSLWMVVAATLGEAPLLLAAETLPTYIMAGKEWIPLDAPHDIVPGTPLDFSGMLDAPAGKYGRVVVAPDGHFSFANAPDRRIKFVGVNLCFSANFLSKESADALAERLARMGYNAVRLHHQDNQLVKKNSPDSTELDLEQLDKLEYLFAALKKRGLYITTDVYVSRKLKPAEKIPEKVPGNSFFQMKALLPISKAARRNWERFARNWFTHRNPYTGMTWAEDPAFYLVSFTNENNLYTVWDKAPEIAKLYQEKFPGWMAKQHPDEPIESADISNRRFQEFLYDCQHRSILEQARFLREELGMKTLCTDVNMHNKVPLALLRDDLDAVDDHKYHDHPAFPENDWGLPMLFRQRSAIGSYGDEVPLQLLAPRLFGKPFSITEYKFCPPNRYRAEGGPLIGGYAALQDWDALYHFAWSHSSRNVDKLVDFSIFDIAHEPLGQLSDRLTMFLFRRGDISPAQAAYAYPVPKNLWDTDQPLLYPRSFEQLGLITRIGTVVSNRATAGVKQLSLKQAAAEAPLPDPAVEKLRHTLLTRGIATSSTGELQLNVSAKTLTLVSPRSESVTLPAGKLSAGRLTVTGATVPQTVSVSSLDGVPLGRSSSILIFHMTNVLSQRMKFGDSGLHLLENRGTFPLLLRRDPVEITLKLEGDAPVTLTALKLDGTSAGTVAVTRKKGGFFHFTADPGAFSGGTMVYHLTR